VNGSPNIEAFGHRIGYERWMNRFSDITPVEIAGTAALLSDVARAAIVCALLDGRARTAGELAFAAGVTPQTASSHLARLVEGGMIAVVPQGRHRYHRLASPEAAQMLEALGLLSTGLPRRARLPGPRDAALRAARTCYDHLAGQFGVAIADALRIAGGTVVHDRDVEITPEGERRLACLRVDVPRLRTERRPLCRQCLDWSERRPHLAGSVPSQILHSALAAGWLTRLKESRAVRVTPEGRRVFAAALGSGFEELAAAA
jgi:DNA-binding transcriptional ArsR family regulator